MENDVLWTFRIPGPQLPDEVASEDDPYEHRPELDRGRRPRAWWAGYFRAYPDGATLPQTGQRLEQLLRRHRATHRANRVLLSQRAAHGRWCPHGRRYPLASSAASS